MKFEFYQKILANSFMFSLKKDLISITNIQLVKRLHYFSQSALTLWQSQETSISNKDLYRAETSDVRYCERSTHKTNVFRWQQVFLSNKVKSKVYIILFQKYELRNSNLLKNFSFWRLYSRQNINKKWLFLTTEMT